MQRIINLIKRWMRFNAIGAMGVCVQISVLLLLTTVFEVNSFVATVIGVQCALIHNFLWHQRWTWRGTSTRSRRESWRRFVRFNSGSGTISMVGNLGFTLLLLQIVHLPYVICNVLAIGACNIVNFAFSHNFVFRPSAELITAGNVDL